MIKTVLVLAAFLSFSCASFANSTGEAYFEISILENTIKVEAEFPLAIREGAVEFDSLMTKVSSKDDFQKSFFKYVENGFKLSDESGRYLRLLSVKELANSDHPHQNDFEFIFEGNEFIGLENILLCERQNQHKNYHELLFRNKKITFDTDCKNSEHTINSNEFKPDTTPFIWFGIITVVSIVMFLVFRRVKK